MSVAGSRIPEREERARAGGVRGLDVEEVGRIEVRDHPDHEHDDRRDGHRGDDEHYPKSLAGAVQVHPYEDRVEEKVDQRPANTDQRLHGTPDEGDDGGRGERVLDQDRRAREEPSPHPHGPAGETVAGPRDRDGCRHLGQRVDHCGVHDRHENRGNEQATPPALGEPEVPARKLTGDNVRHPQSCQEYPAGRTFLQLALLQVLSPDPFVLDPSRLFMSSFGSTPSRFTHLDLPSPKPTEMAHDRPRYPQRFPKSLASIAGCGPKPTSTSFRVSPLATIAS